VAAWHNKAELPVGEGLNKTQQRGLERRPLETVGLDKHSLVWGLDEEAVTQTQDLAGEE
jgi:hypothetical protein